MLTQLATVKARLGIEAFETRHDTLLLNFIKLASGRFEKECARLFGRADNCAEEFAGCDTELRVTRYPIERVAAFAVKRSEDEGWQEQSGVEYVLRQSCVISLAAPLGDGRDQLRVVYTGGYVLPGAAVESGQTALPADLELACVEQVSFLFKNRERLGLISFAGLRSDYEYFFGPAGEGGGNPESAVRIFWQFQQLDLLPQIRPLLAKYQRHAL